MTALEKRLLNRLQENFPIDPHPFAVIGEELGMTEHEVIAYVQRFKEQGYIRRIGPFYSSRHLGYTSTLVALAVPEERIEEVAKLINRYIGVTHNYIREDVYNVWFTYIAENKEKLEQVLASIREKTGLHDMLILPATHTFKVNVNLKVGEDGV